MRTVEHKKRGNFRKFCIVITIKNAENISNFVKMTFFGGSWNDLKRGNRGRFSSMIRHFQGTKLTYFIVDDGVGLHAIAKLVGLATHNHGDTAWFRCHGNHCGTDRTHDVSVAEESVGAKHHFRYLVVNKADKWHTNETENMKVFANEKYRNIFRGKFQIINLEI